MRRFAALSPEERFIFLRERRAQYVSSFVLFLVPAFASALGLLYRRQRRNFVDHLVFGLHFQTVLLLALLVESVLPALVANLMSFGVIGHLLVALRRVYGGDWAGAIVRGVAILLLYFAIFVIANLAVVTVLLSL